MEINSTAIEYAAVDEIPVAFCKPDPKFTNGTIALWIPYLGGDKNTGLTELRALAKAGYFACCETFVKLLWKVFRRREMRI